MKYVAAFFLLGAGFVGGAFWALWPNATEQYTIKLKTACVAKEGVPVQFNYEGRGGVHFLIVPPDAAPKAEKGSK